MIPFIDHIISLAHRACRGSEIKQETSITKDDTVGAEDTHEYVLLGDSGVMILTGRRIIRPKIIVVNKVSHHVLSIIGRAGLQRSCIALVSMRDGSHQLGRQFLHSSPDNRDYRYDNYFCYNNIFLLSSLPPTRLATWGILSHSRRL